MTPTAQPLDKTLRRKLERAVVQAREEATAAARAAIHHLGVGEPKAPGHLDEDQKALRRRLRAHGRQAGDHRHPDGRQDTRRLADEVAYEHWHRMLFARFLAESHLLMHPDGVPLTLAECEELAPGEGAADGWELAGRYAARMLPQIFRPDSPALALKLAPEDQRALEKLLEGLEPAVFTAGDALGWVYQFWQTAEKERVNRSEVKIGADELPAVTQLFTEPYMVSFLLDNALGAWWAARRLTDEDLVNAESEEELRKKAAIPGVPLEYLRFVRTPPDAAAGEAAPTRVEAEAPNVPPNPSKTIPSPPRGEGQSSIPSPPGGEGQGEGDNNPTPSAEKSPSQGEGETKEEAQHPWTPAAGTFDTWPGHLGDLEVMDPCCGSGHFLVAAFHMLVPMRMALEGLDAAGAVDAVLRENLHGLELDPRCVEIAAFALALAAWRFPNLPSPSGTNPPGADLNSRQAGPKGGGQDARNKGAGGEGMLGYRPLPRLNLACSGLGIHAKKNEWLALAEGDQALEHALERLYELFRDAPTLGSLIDPRQVLKDDLLGDEWSEVRPLLSQALETSDEDSREMGVAAQGMAAAAELLAGRYHWVVTNVPYLSRGKQHQRLRDFAETHYPRAKNDLANVFLERCLDFCREEGAGVTQIVMPQNWLFLTSYRGQREHLLKEVRWGLLARLGPGAFDTISGEVVNVILLTLTRTRPQADHLLRGIDASAPRTAVGKAEVLRDGEVVAVSQKGQLGNPDARIALEESSCLALLSRFATSYQGITTGDNPKYICFFWEISDWGNDWQTFQSTGDVCEHFSGREQVFLWEDGNGVLASSDAARIQGQVAWQEKGIAVRQMRELPATINSGSPWDMNCATIVPTRLTHLPAIWCFCSSPEYNQAVRRIDQKLNVTNATLVKVPFDLDHWTRVAAERYPNGLPKPYSDDPTQWIFHGHPCGSVIWDEETKWTAHGPLRTDDTVLQVAVARLLAYRWPAEKTLTPDPSPGGRGEEEMELSDESREWVARCAELDPFADDDGIVCIPTVRGEKPAAERLMALLQAAYGEEWTANTLGTLLAESGAQGKTLEWWLRERFFEQHCKLFQHRPFIWHVWDGLKDGFAALVNYHTLDRKHLESLIYTYLDDWIGRQEAAVREGEDGAQLRLDAARGLKKRLELILEGEPPYDIFVRWKPLEQQPLGWEPDLNDGVRLNIRPFMTAEVLRHNKKPKLNIHWNKDRGRDVPSAPWYHLGPEYGGKAGDRINDHHLTLAEKKAAREEAKGETRN